MAKTEKGQPVAAVMDKRARIEAALRAHPDKGPTEIAQMLGTHRALVGRIRKQIVEGGVLEDKRSQIAIPEGKVLSELCAVGIAMEAQGLSPDDVALKLGLSRNVYRCARDILQLANNPNLMASDSAKAIGARTRMDQGQVFAAYDDVESLIRRMWGSNRGAPHDAKRLSRIIENYMHAVVVFAEGANRIHDLEVPFLGESDRATARSALRQARMAIDGAIKHLNGGVTNESSC